MLGANDAAADPEPMQRLPENDLLVYGSVIHAPSGLPLGRVRVTAVADGLTELGSAVTDDDGCFSIMPADEDGIRRRVCLLRCTPEDRLTCRVVEADGTVVAESKPLRSSDLPQPVEIAVSGAGIRDRGDYALLADAVVTSRRARVGDVARELASPPGDSPVRMFSARARAGMLSELVDAFAREMEATEAALDELMDDAFISTADGFLDPVRMREGTFVLDRHQTVSDAWTHVDDDRFHWAIHQQFGWARADDESYRDYLRGVFVLFVHQQAVGFTGNLTQWTGLIEEQLANRFFQDFKTGDRAQVPLNRLLIPLLRKILTAPIGSGFGLGIPVATLPAQGTLSDRQYLDALLALAPIAIEELANRYRLDLDEPDTAMSSPVLLNVATLKRILSDTAQGPVEPEENAIVPPLPNFRGKPILWDTVVGAAPFFLRYYEWLERQKPFFPENLFSLRTQIQGHVWNEPWLNKATADYLAFHANVTTAPISSYNDHFGSIDEVRRSATFLQQVGAADAKLFEVLVAYDRGEYRKALRLADEAEALLRTATPRPVGSEDWEPLQQPNVNFPRPMSFARRRKLPAGTIAELTGTAGAYPVTGLERFFELPRMGYSGEFWTGDIIRFAQARGIATRLVRYQRAFVLPLLRSLAHLENGSYASAVDAVAPVSGCYVGIAAAATPGGAAYDAYDSAQLRAVHRRGSLAYTTRVAYQRQSLRLSRPLQKQRSSMWDPKPDMTETDLHLVDEAYARLLQADALLRWAEVLYRTDDADSLERARELYKGVLLVHGQDPGTLAYHRILPTGPLAPPENPRRAAQITRARLALLQLESQLNYYGYRDDLVPALRYRALLDAARRWSAGAKAAQNDFLQYMTRIEQLDLDILAARAQQKKAQASAQIAREQVEIAKAGVDVTRRLVTAVEKQIEEKKKEIEDASSLFNQFKDYIGGIKDTVSSVVDVGKGAYEGGTALGVIDAAQAKAAVKGLGSQAAMGVGMGGLAVVGAMGAFTAFSVMSLQGMADAATKRDAELKALVNEALPAAHAAVRVQERLTTIAQLQESIATTELAYATDLVAYHGDRFLNRDFWSSLVAVARRSMSRQLDLAAQAAWFAERALAFEIGRPLKIIRFDYFDARLRDVGGVDRLTLDLTELEAVRLSSARVSLPIKRTYSLARDLPLAFGRLKRTGRCTFALSADDLSKAHPGTFAHRIRAVGVRVEAPGAAMPIRGLLSNGGVSHFRRSPAEPSRALVRYADALPVSEFALRDDMAVYDMPGELLMAFEGSGFSTTWELDFPDAANPGGLVRLADVLLTFDVRAEYDDGATGAAGAPASVSRALFISALSLDTDGFATLRGPSASAIVRFRVADLVIPGSGGSPKITNIAVLLPGIDAGLLQAKLRLAGSATTVPFTIENGVALSNAAHLSDAVPANAQPLNAIVSASPLQTIEVEITKPAGPNVLEPARDVVLWVEYEHS